jgi:hypothetical protein
MQMALDVQRLPLLSYGDLTQTAEPKKETSRVFESRNHPAQFHIESAVSTPQTRLEGNRIEKIR